MLNVADLRAVIDIYREDIKKCKEAGAGWAVLHLASCLPDVCGALCAPNGFATGKTFKDWCSRYLTDAHLGPCDRYDIRCEVLHRGSAHVRPKHVKRYRRFAYGMPTVHYRLTGDTLHIDVSRLATQTLDAVDAWLHDLARDPSSPEALLVALNLKTLVRVERQSLPAQAPAGLGNTVAITK